MKLNLFLIALFAYGCSFAQPADTKQGQAKTIQPAKSNLVQRNKNADIIFLKDQVYQDNKVIGGVQMAQGTEKGQIVKTFSVLFTDVFKIAEAKCYGTNSHEWHISTLKDKHTHVLHSTDNNDAVDVIEYLIKGLYL